MMRFVVTGLVTALATSTLAEDEAGPEDLREINEELSDLNCGPVDEAEQETSYLFELDDVPCKAHQYDIKVRKVDGNHTVVSMTYDGPLEGDDAPSEEDITKITAMLTEMQCEMDSDDIEREGDGFELDDVFCADGQFDIDLDGNFEMTSKRAE